MKITKEMLDWLRGKGLISKEKYDEMLKEIENGS